MSLVVLFTNVAKFECSGQLLLAFRSVDQHHPLTPPQLRRGIGGGYVIHSLDQPI